MPSISALFHQLDSLLAAGAPMPETLDAYGLLVDAAGDADDEVALIRATELASAVEAGCSGWRICWARYCRANAWSELYRLRRYPELAFSWDQPELLSQIFNLRSALQHESIFQLEPIFRAQLHCNLGNALNTNGRIIEAIEQWEVALKLNPLLVMARGSLGKGLEYYARNIYDDGHQLWLLLRARQHLHDGVKTGLGRDGATYPEALEHFREQLEIIDGRLADAGVSTSEQVPTLDPAEIAETEREHEYRCWCLQRRLFLNPLNDAYLEPVAARDVLMLPSHRGDGIGITYLAFFNQMKEEYVYARWCLFDGATSTKVHFADRHVTLALNADNARYSIALEQVKTAFRSAYSLLDKVAYFVNSYWQLEIPEKKVDFNSVWTEQKKPRFGQVRETLESSKNLPLQALYWLSKDIFDSEHHRVAEPNARQLNDLRNHLEHKFVKVVDVKSTGDEPSMSRDQLAHEITPDELVARAERIMKIARSALVYLCLAMHRAERQRYGDRDDVIAFDVSDIPDSSKF